MSQSDVAIDAIVRGGLADIVPDSRPTCDRLVRLPWTKRKSKGVHIGIGPHARIAEEIPRAPDCIARLENRVGFSGKRGLQMVGGINTGHSGANDQYVEIFL